MSTGGSKQTADIKKLFDAEAMRAEHIMGLDGDMEFKYKSEVVRRESSGNYASSSIGYLSENLESYIPKLKSEDQQDWAKIRNAFIKAKQEAKDGHSVDCVPDNLKRIKAGQDKNSRELVHLGNSMWFGDDPHSIGITFYGNYMVVCDRGEYGGKKDCTKIYKIDPDKITSKQLEALQSTPDKPDVMLNTIKEIAGHSPPIATFPSKMQKFGTCTYANRLTSVEPMLCLVKLDRQGKLNDEAIKAYSQSKDRKEYKDFTKHNRDTEIDRIIKKLNAAKDNPELQGMYANLAIEIVKNRQKYISKMRDPDKKQTETMRNDKLIRAVANIYPAIKENITPSNQNFYTQYASKLPQIPVSDPIADLVQQKDPSFVPGHVLKTSPPQPTVEPVVQQPAISFSQLKKYLDNEQNKALHHITNIEVQKLGFKSEGRLKLEIQAPTDTHSTSVYVDDNGKDGVNYSLDEAASPEQKKRAIESICKLAVENSTLETEFNLDDTPNDIKADVKVALENAIKEKYKNPEEAPKIKSREPTSHLKAG